MTSHVTPTGMSYLYINSRGTKVALHKNNSVVVICYVQCYRFAIEPNMYKIHIAITTTSDAKLGSILLK